MREFAGAVLPTIVGRHRRRRNEAAGESKRERGRKVLIFGRNSKIGAEETSTSRSRQILRDPERFKEVRGIPLFFPRFNAMLYFYYVYQLEEV